MWSSPRPRSLASATRTAWTWFSGMMISQRLCESGWLTYHQQTQPLVDYYSKHGLVRDVDGTRTPEMVEAEVEAALA